MKILIAFFTTTLATVSLTNNISIKINDLKKNDTANTILPTLTFTEKVSQQNFSSIDETSIKSNATTFSFFITTTTKNENPYSTLYSIINGKKKFTAKVGVGLSKYEKSAYQENGIPKNALDACGGWWAGGGDYFYAIKTKTGIDVFRGYEEEQDEETGKHWKKIKSY
jgi:hypothetical protein